MKVRGVSCNLIGPEGSSPPLPYLEVEDGEALALIAMGLAMEVPGDGEEASADPETERLAAEAAEAAAREAEETQAREAAEAAEREAAAQAEAEANASAEAEAEAARLAAEAEAAASAAAGNGGGQEGATRAEMIAEALDLMEAGDLVKNGERAGKPKVSAIEAATGLTDVHADEIDAAVAAREAAANA